MKKNTKETVIKESIVVTGRRQKTSKVFRRKKEKRNEYLCGRKREKRSDRDKNYWKAKKQKTTKRINAVVSCGS